MNCLSTTFGTVSEKKFCLNPAGVVAQRIRAFLFYSVGGLLAFPDKGNLLNHGKRWKLDSPMSQNIKLYGNFRRLNIGQEIGLFSKGVGGKLVFWPSSYRFLGS